jgi:hypothetical protein
MMKLGQRVAAGAAGACAAAAISVAIAAPANAGSSYIYTQSGRPAALALCNNGYQNCGGIGSFYPSNGSGANMLCWTDQNYYNGNYNSNRWFVITIDGHPGQWFIHSSYVYYQTSVGHC